MIGGSMPFERRFMIAAVIESLFLVPAIVIFVLTENILWIIGGAVIGSIPILYVIFTNARSPGAPRAKEAGAASIVEDARERR